MICNETEKLNMLRELFVFSILSLHNVPLQLQIVVLALPSSMLLQLFAASPLPQPSP